jgi:hypothetical protein
MFRYLLLLSIALTACGTSPTAGFVEQLNVAISRGNQPISDVEGPYGAVSVKTHVVALRVWPDSLADGLAEANIIVTNESWNTIEVTINDIALESASGSLPVLGKPQMLAALSGDSSATAGIGERDIVLQSERQSSHAARSQQGSGGGSRQSGDIEGAMMDPAIAQAARLAGSTGTTSAAASPEEVEQRRQSIEDWYLDRLEIYPGDTGVGGISFPLPANSQDLVLTVSLYGEEHTFDIEYIREKRDR